MNIGNTHSIPALQDAALPVAPEDGVTSDAQAGEHALSCLTGKAGFSSLLPRLQAAFAHMDHEGPDMLDLLTDNITRLQDSFMESLYADLKRINIDLAAKLTLRLDDEACLRVAGDHPDREAIDDLLRRRPEFSAALAEIAAQSAALRNLRSLRILTLPVSSAHSYALLSSGPGETVYQVSLKGEMHHFYFTR